MRESSPCSVSEFRPHDLLWVAEATDLLPVDALPSWASPAWLSVAPVVVRRAPATGGRVPVGLRGATRSERCAAHVRAGRITRRITPQDIARGVSPDGPLRDSTLPCLRALARLAAELDQSALDWGVTGGVGFTLASGLGVLRADSDLDLIVCAPHRRSASALRALGMAVRGAESRVDVQVEAPNGAFALNEWLRTGGPVLLKTHHGPALCDDPWQASVRPASLQGRPSIA